MTTPTGRFINSAIQEIDGTVYAELYVDGVKVTASNPVPTTGDGTSGGGAVTDEHHRQPCLHVLYCRRDRYDRHPASLPRDSAQGDDRQHQHHLRCAGRDRCDLARPGHLLRGDVMSHLPCSVCDEQYDCGTVEGGIGL